jgi:hypothetical protein
MASAPVKLSELKFAFEFLGSGEAAGIETATYICLDTGRIYYKSDWENPDDPLPNDLETSDRYVDVPGPHTFRLGRRLAMSFIEEASPDDYRKVADIFQRRGAFARFKDLLVERGLLARWHDYEDHAQEAALRVWCADNGITLAAD